MKSAETAEEAWTEAEHRDVIGCSFYSLSFTFFHRD